MPVFSADELKRVVDRVFSALGASPEESLRLQDHLVENNLIGYDSHGVRVVPDYVELIRKGHIVFGAALDVIQESSSHAVLDGNWGLGQLMGWRAARLAADKAKKGAVAVVTLRNCSHIGRLGEFVELIANEGLVAFLTVNGQGGAQLVAPWGGLDRRLSVNPFAYGIPGPERAIVVDVSPTVVAGGKVAVKALRGELIPEGWVMDGAGQATTDPNNLAEGSLIPLGGHKGYALGLVMDILAGALSGGGCSKPNPERWGNATFIMAVNPTAFVDQQDFEDDIQVFLAYVQSSRRVPGVDQIMIPGEPESHEKARRLEDGIMVEEPTWNNLMSLVDELKA